MIDVAITAEPLQRYDIRRSLDGLVKVDVKYEEYPDCHLGKCVDNAFKYAKHNEDLIIVRGYINNADNSVLLVEHFWCQDRYTYQFFDTTPFCMSDHPETEYYLEEELIPQLN